MKSLIERSGPFSFRKSLPLHLPPVIDQSTKSGVGRSPRRERKEGRKGKKKAVQIWYARAGTPDSDTDGLRTDVGWRRHTTHDT
jgi:hypothetical protein